MNPAFHLYHGLDEASRAKPVNPRRFGARVWFETSTHRLTVFTREEARAIVAYLRYKAEQDPHASRSIDEAIRNFWAEKAER